MEISIIGAGNIGSVLAANLVKLGHNVHIANSRGPGTLRNVAKETGATPVSIHEAVRSCDMLFIAIPIQNIPKLPEDLFLEVSESTVVVETSNYYPTLTGEKIPEIENGLLESEWVQKQIGRPVIKAFNSISVWSLRDAGKSKGDENRISVPVSGDSEQGKAKVIHLVEELGFDGYNAGNLKDSWKQQPGTSIYCTDLKRTDFIRSFNAMHDVYTPEIQRTNAATRDAIIEAYLKSLQE